MNEYNRFFFFVKIQTTAEEVSPGVVRLKSDLSAQVSNLHVHVCNDLLYNIIYTHWRMKYASLE